ncbi:MAG TPA: DUF2935 domain-containing protein [Bacillota bacterium]|nr:DUF2935 domain-containing protein [Bacillota bacterium]
MMGHEFVRKSLELNLFFARIAKEHAFFIEVALPWKNSNLVQEADMYKNEFANLLAEAVRLADGVLSQDFLNAGEIVTPLTLDAERASEFYSGYPLNTEITLAELTLGGAVNPNSKTLVDEVVSLNQRAMALTTGLIGFKSRLLNDVLSCAVFNFNYPLLLDHILREACFYLNMLEGIQSNVTLDPVTDLVQQEIFWNRIMAEHAKFIRGFLDPTEEQLFNTADNFGKQFDALTTQAQMLINQPSSIPVVTEESRRATTAIRDFKTQGTEGLITCQIRAIAHPLLGDHVVREANHYLRLLSLS